MSSRNKRKPKRAQQNGGKKPSPTAQILEHVELLIAMHEEQADSGGSDSGGSDFGGSEKGNQPDIVDDISRKLESQIGARFDAIEKRIENSGSRQNGDLADNDSSSSSLSQLLERFDSIESKLTAVEEKLENSGSQPLSAPKIQERFEAIDSRLEKVATAIAGQQRLIEDRQPNPDAVEINSLRDQFSEMVSQMKTELANVTENKTSLSDQPEGDEESVDEKGTDWSLQKQAMLSKYGIDPAHRPDMAPPTAPDPVLETTIADGQLNPAIELESVKEVSTDPEELKQIKKELNQKLRDAEVELSIERAKLSQLHAELESKQVELERRDTELTEKYSGRIAESGQQQSSLLDRLKRHLTAKDRKNLDRI